MFLGQVTLAKLGSIKTKLREVKAEADGMSPYHTPYYVLTVHIRFRLHWPMCKAGGSGTEGVQWAK